MIKQINKDLKTEALVKASDVEPIQRISTGLYSMDEFTGGGLPLSVPVMLNGFKSTAKSAFCYHMAGRVVQERGGTVTLMQTEPGFDVDWSALCGLPLNKTAICMDVGTLSVALDMILKILKDTKPSCVIFDSLSGLSSDPTEAVSDSKSYGGRAKPMNDFFRKLNYFIDAENPPLIIFIEHLHPIIGGRGYTTTGGETKGYMAVMEMRFNKKLTISQVIGTGAGETELPIQIDVGWNIRKSKVCAHGGGGQFSLDLRESVGTVPGRISDYAELLALASMMGVVKKRGAWFQVGEDKYQGALNLQAAVSRDALFEMVMEGRKEPDGEGQTPQT